MKVLFICSANKDRSITAEEYARENFPMHEYDSAGTNRKICFQLGTQLVQTHQLLWADKIICMESKHKKEIQKLVGAKFNSKLAVLHIKDRYPYNSAGLKEILKEKLGSYLK